MNRYWLLTALFIIFAVIYIVIGYESDVKTLAAPAVTVSDDYEQTRYDWYRHCQLYFSLKECHIIAFKSENLWKKDDIKP